MSLPRSLRVSVTAMIALGAAALVGCAGESADSVEDGTGALAGAANTCSADTDDANLRAATHKLVENSVAAGHRATNIKVGQVGIGLPGKPRTIFFTATDEQASVPAGETIRLNLVGSAVIQPNCSGTIENRQVVVDAATMITGTTKGHCGLDTEDDNLRSVAVAFIEKEIFTSSVHTESIRVGLAGFSAPSEERTIYFSNTITGSGESHAIAGKLVVTPDCKVVSKPNQALED